MRKMNTLIERLLDGNNEACCTVMVSASCEPIANTDGEENRGNS